MRLWRSGSWPRCSRPTGSSRAYEIAEQLMETSTITSRLSVHVIRQEIKERLLHNVGFGLALEGLDLVQQTHRAPQ